MLTIYWVCLLGGLLFTVLAFFVGDMLEGALDALDATDGLLDPLSLIGGIAAFGGAGIIIDATSALENPAAVLLAAGVGLALAVVMHFVYVKPMKRGETSTGFSIEEYRGRTGEVITTIPEKGYGEVLVQLGFSNTFRQAASFANEMIPTGTRIVVVDVVDGDLLVARFDEDEQSILPQAGGPEPQALLTPSN